MKVTLLQLDSQWASPQENILRAQRLMDQQPNSDLYVLPEVWATGFATEPHEIAEDEKHSLALSWMCQTARERHCALCGSLAIVTPDGCFRNRHYFVHPSGEVFFYDKHHLFMGEEEFFTPGESKTIVNTLGYKFLPLICFDVRFPEWSRNRMVKSQFDYDCLLYTANFPAPRESELITLAQARAIENQAYALVVNRTGVDGYGRRHAGGCAVINPHGEIEAKTTSSEEQILIHSCDFDTLKPLRELFPVSKFW